MLPIHGIFSSTFQKNQTRWKKLEEKFFANYMGNKLNENKLDDVFLVSYISKAFFLALFTKKPSLNSNDLQYLWANVSFDDKFILFQDLREWN